MREVLWDRMRGTVLTSAPFCRRVSPSTISASPGAMPSLTTQAFRWLPCSVSSRCSA